VEREGAQIVFEFDYLDKIVVIRGLAEGWWQGLKPLASMGELGYRLRPAECLGPTIPVTPIRFALS